MADGDLLGAVLEPRRRAILRLLDEQPMPVGLLAQRFDVSRPAISQHLGVLRSGGLVAVESAEGRNRYRVVRGGVARAAAALAALAAELPGGADEDRRPELAVALLAEASAERLFDLVTTAAGLARWLGAATVDLRP